MADRPTLTVQKTSALEHLLSAFVTKIGMSAPATGGEMPPFKLFCAEDPYSRFEGQLANN
jgi:hypothetical protein